MGFFDAFRGWGRSHAEQTDWSPNQSNVYFMLPEDTALWSAPASRTALRQKFEWLRQNFGLIQALPSGIARHTVGKGITVQQNSKDAEWNAEADQQLEEWMLTPDRCDAAGRRNFYEQQLFAVEQFIGPGEFFARDAFNERWGGEPCVQLYDAHEIQTPKDNKDSSILDGIRVDGLYRPTEIFSREATKDGTKYVPSPANQWVHWFKATTANQVRGVTPFAPAINKLVNIHELTSLTMKTAKTQALIAMVLKGVDKKKSSGALGSIKNLGAAAAGYNGAQDTAAVEQLYTGAGGAIAYLGSEGDAKLLSTNSPSPLVESFISDLLLRDVSLAPRVPVEFFWSPDKLSGPNVRFIMARADLLFSFLGDSLAYRFIRRQSYRVLQWRMQKGLLRQCNDPEWAAKMTCQMPRRVTVDNGRDTSAQMELLANGATTLRDIYDEQGASYRDKTRQWIRECNEFLAIAKAEGTPQEVIDKWMASMPVWRAHASGAGVAMPKPFDAEPTDKEKTK